MKTEIYHIPIQNEAFWQTIESLRCYVPRICFEWGNDGMFSVTAPEEWFGNIGDEFAAFC